MWTSSTQVERRQSLPHLVCRLWAGLACGWLAGVVTLVWFALHSLMRGEFWWAKFNVAASWFYAAAVYHAGLSWVTLCGASVIILFFCVAGAGYASLRDAVLSKRAFLTTALYVTSVYIFAAYFFWPSFGPFARIWFPWTATLPAHVALFAMLARYPEFYVRLVNDFGDPLWLPRKRAESFAEAVATGQPQASLNASDEASSSTESKKD